MTNSFQLFLRTLQIRDLVEQYPRTLFFEVLQQLKSKRFDVFVLSHHMDNPLNFLHLECFYLKYPVIHNTARYTSAG